MAEDKKAPDTSKEMNKSATSMGTSDSTLRFLPIGEIHDDTVILKDGSLRAIVEVTSINFSLKSEQEQDAIILSYQNFLNSLEFPIQIYIRSKKLELDDYITSLKGISMNQENQLLKNQTQEYIAFISKLVEFADIMEKKFYCIVPYSPNAATVTKGAWQTFLDAINPDDSVLKYKSRLKNFVDNKKKLVQRSSVIQSGLENCGLQTRVLSTKELIQLYYSIYNPTTALSQKLRDPNTNMSILKE